MRRVFAIMLALVMILSMGITAFAATENGSITVTNATPGQTYSIYKIFDATYSEAEDTKAVAYSIAQGDVFDLLFENGENPYFIYNAQTGAITKKETVNDSELITYLTDQVKNLTPDASIVAQSDEVKFENLPNGYYVVVSTLGAAVTITSNTPSVSVIDKNQLPFESFTKLVKNKDDNAVFSAGNSCNIGDMITYKVEFDTTNYYGANKIKYYQVHDEIGEAIWIDFESIQVMVGDEPLTKGYYLNATGAPAEDWEHLGGWTGDRDDAQWYLVHQSNDTFRITIPWLEGHTVENIDEYSFRLNTPLENNSLYETGAKVVITYNATVEADAFIGGGSTPSMKNKAYASAICQHETYTTSPSEVLTEVYGLGVLKDDGSTGDNLAGAVFRLYSDEACNTPVYVIPTDIDGIYMVDCRGKESNSIEGVHQLPRQVYGGERLMEYLGENIQDNYLVSQVNGKLVVLGLAEGTYYLREVEAPAGYNSLTAPVALELDTNNAHAFSVFADANGKVLDDQFGGVGYTEHEYRVTSTIVHNSKGVELPSTGGEGTILLITIGTVIAMAFAVLMITQKKMSIYKD